MPELSWEARLRSDATLVRKTVTQNLEQHSPESSIRPLLRTDTGGLRPVDFPCLIDADQDACGRPGTQGRCPRSLAVGSQRVLWRMLAESNRPQLCHLKAHVETAQPSSPRKSLQFQPDPQSGPRWKPMSTHASVGRMNFGREMRRTAARRPVSESV